MGWGGKNTHSWVGIVSTPFKLLLFPHRFLLCDLAELLGWW